MYQKIPQTSVYTYLSIGSMINGMEARPTAVTVHLRRTGDGRIRRDTRLLSSTRERAQMRLMVKPGIMTEARPCHMRVSSTAADGLVLWICVWLSLYDIESEIYLYRFQTYLYTYILSTGSVSLLESMSSHIATGYQVAEVHPSHCYHVTERLSHFVGVACRDSGGGNHVHSAKWYATQFSLSIKLHVHVYVYSWRFWRCSEIKCVPKYLRGTSLNTSLCSPSATRSASPTLIPKMRMPIQQIFGCYSSHVNTSRYLATEC